MFVLFLPAAGDAGKLDCSEVTRENHEVIAQKTVNLSPYVVAPDMGQDCRDSVTQEGMKSSKAVRFKRRLRGVENQHCKKFVEAEKASTFKEASTTVKSTKRKLKYVRKPSDIYHFVFMLISLH